MFELEIVYYGADGSICPSNVLDIDRDTQWLLFSKDLWNECILAVLDKGSSVQDTKPIAPFAIPCFTSPNGVNISCEVELKYVPIHSM